MAVAALITWLLTAIGGFVMLGLWLRHGGGRQRGAGSISPPLIYAHFAVAVVGLILWIIFLFNGAAGVAWTALVLLVPVAALGFGMLARWVPTYRATASATAGARVTRAVSGGLPAERHFPVAVVAGHGLLAVVTVVLVLLSALAVTGR